MNNKCHGFWPDVRCWGGRSVHLLGKQNYDAVSIPFPNNSQLTSNVSGRTIPPLGAHEGMICPLPRMWIIRFRRWKEFSVSISPPKNLQLTSDGNGRTINRFSAHWREMFTLPFLWVIRFYHWKDVAVFVYPPNNVHLTSDGRGRTNNPFDDNGGKIIPFSQWCHKHWMLGKDAGERSKGWRSLICLQLCRFGR